MIWINTGDKSYQAIGMNINELESGFAELWIERPTGKNLKLLVGDVEEIREHKQAIDFAIKTGHTSYELKEV